MIRAYASSIPPYLEAAVAILWGAALGMAFGIVDPQLILVGIIGVVVLPFLINHPELSLLGMLIAYSSIISVDVLPLLPIGIGSLNILDLALGGFLGLAVLRRIVERDFVIEIRPVGVALIVFYATVVISTISGIILGTTVVEEATTEIRYVTYYLAYFVLFILVTDERKLRFLVMSFMALAFVVAVGMLAQFIAGPDVTIIYGRIEAFSQSGIETDDVTRIIPAGRYLIYMAFNIAPLLVVFEMKTGRKLLYMVLWGLLGIGIILTFNRNFWVSSAVVQFLYMLALGKRYRQSFIQIWIVLFVFLGILVGIISLNPDTPAAKALDSTVVRFTSLFSSDTYNAEYDERSNASSLEFRRIENDHALPYLFPPRPLGLGMGANYRDFVPSIDWVEGGFDGRGYIHNSHFWIIIKGGMISYIALISAFFITAIQCARNWKRLPRRWQPFALGSSVALLGILLSATVDPILVDLTWSPVCGVVMGMNEAIMRHVLPEKV